MKFKIDQNLPVDLAERLNTLGHDAVTAAEEGLADADDRLILEVCTAGGRALVTLDLDFSDIRTSPPQETPGIILLRPHEPSKAAVLGLVDQMAAALVSRPLAGPLWIVEEKGIRFRTSRATGR